MSGNGAFNGIGDRELHYGNEHIMYDLFPKAFNRTSPKSQILPAGSAAEFLLTSVAITDSSSGLPSHRILSRNNNCHQTQAAQLHCIRGPLHQF